MLRSKRSIENSKEQWDRGTSLPSSMWNKSIDFIAMVWRNPITMCTYLHIYQFESALIWIMNLAKIEIRLNYFRSFLMPQNFSLVKILDICRVNLPCKHGGYPDPNNCYVRGFRINSTKFQFSEMQMSFRFVFFSSIIHPSLRNQGFWYRTRDSFSCGITSFLCDQLIEQCFDFESALLSQSNLSYYKVG